MTALPPERVTAASLMILPWCALLMVLAVVAPATDANWAAADPIMRFLPRLVTVWGIPVLGLAVMTFWFFRARPTLPDMGRATVAGLLGVISSGLIVGTIRWVAGPTPPPFVPTEESNAPGLLLGMGAGVGEELVFRLLLVPFLFWAVEKRLPKMPAIFVTAILTGVVFSLIHALGGGDPPLAWHFSRFALPGFLMTFAYLRLGPSFLITAHCAAHVWIPLVFP